VRIIAGAWRGRPLAVPTGTGTRPTADRVRQALFDMLMHAPWAGARAVREAQVLDGFAGTGAFGLEALSRGAAFAHFMEFDKAALSVLRANISACRAEAASRVLAADALRPPAGVPCSLVFLDPPYGENLVPRAMAALAAAGWLAAGGLVVAELGRGDPVPTDAELLADRVHGAARLLAWRNQ
jgi:16S rRNA (guanine966-N2)-methyltransferase